MMSTTMRSVAIQREVELLWQAAESERSKAQRLQLELTDTTAALHEALADLREASEEVANLKGQLRAVSDRAEDTADHYRHLLFDAQSKATLEERRLQSEHAARLLAVEEREARTAAHEATFRECLAFAQQQLGVEAPNVFASSCRHFIDEFSSDVRRWVRGLQAQSTTDIVDRCASFGDGVNKLWRDGMIEHTMELKSMLTNVDQLTISVAAPSPASLDANVAPAGVQRPVTHDANRGSQRHIAGSSLLEQQFNNFMLASHELRFQHTTLASDLLADSTTFVFARALHSAQIDMMKLAATSASSRSISAEDEDAMRARMEELQEAAAASERRLVSRDGLIQTLKRRATASEDQVTQLQEELRTAEQTNKERERQLQSAASRLHDQQQLSLDLRNALTLRDEELAKVREAGYLPSSSGASHATGSGPMTDLTPESVGRQGATTFLREQLSQQMDLLHRIEESEQRAANERATILVANTMGQLFAAMGHDMLQDRAEYLEWISGRMQEERLFLRERLVEAAEQLAEMDRHRQRLEELIAGTYKSSALAGDGALQQPFHLSSLYDVVEVAMTAPTSSHVFSSASMFGNQRGAERLFVGFDHQLEQHAQHLAAALGALFLEVKLEFNQLQLQAHRSLLRMFWALAPKERASSHVRVHILEGALAVSEAQRIQSVTVAQWLEEQCLAARDSLSNLLRDTREALAGWEDRGGGRYYDSATPPPILAGGGNATLRIGAGGLQSLLVSPAGSPRHGHDGFDASFTLNNTKRSVRTLASAHPRARAGNRRRRRRHVARDAPCRAPRGAESHSVAPQRVPPT